MPFGTCVGGEDGEYNENDLVMICQIVAMQHDFVYVSASFDREYSRYNHLTSIVGDTSHQWAAMAQHRRSFCMCIGRVEVTMKRFIFFANLEYYVCKLTLALFLHCKYVF